MWGLFPKPWNKDPYEYNNQRFIESKVVYWLLADWIFLPNFLATSSCWLVTPNGGAITLQTCRRNGEKEVKSKGITPKSPYLDVPGS